MRFPARAAILAVAAASCGASSAAAGISTTGAARTYLSELDRHVRWTGSSNGSVVGVDVTWPAQFAVTPGAHGRLGGVVVTAQSRATGESSAASERLVESVVAHVAGSGASAVAARFFVHPGTGRRTTEVGGWTLSLTSASTTDHRSSTYGATVLAR